MKPTQEGSTWPVSSVLIGCIFLQRLGLPLGTLKLPVVVVIALGVLIILALQDNLLVSKSALLRYLAFFTTVACSIGLSIAVPPAGTAVAFTSASLLSLLYAFLFLRIRKAPSISQTLAVYRGIMMVVAICGLLQFIGQFLGVRLFSFASFLPDAFLLEKSYATTSPLQYGASVYKSNGFFLLEPSFFSQFVAIALVIEVLYFGSRLRMVLLSLALCAAFSGTGLLVVACAVIVASFTNRQNLLRVGQFAGLALIVIGAFALLAPSDYVEVFAARALEINSTRSSAFLRFVAPNLATIHLGSDPRMLVLGFGPGTSERFGIFETNMTFNALQKLLIEYGVPGLLLCFELLRTSMYRTDMRELSIAGLFLYVIGGGYLLTPSIVFLLVVLFGWSCRAHAPIRATASRNRFAISWSL